MSEVINLNKKRKAKACSERTRKAKENRLKYGRNKVEKEAEKLKARKIDAYLNGHELENKKDQE